MSHLLSTRHGYMSSPHEKAAYATQRGPGHDDQASIPATAVAEAIDYAISQPLSVDVNELIVRPTAQG